MPAGAPYGNQNAKEFSTEILYNKSMKLIKEPAMHFIDDIIASIPCSTATFYEYISINSNELKHIKQALLKNRIDQKQKMRKKWGDSDNATLQFGLYKLIGTEEERQKLSQAYNEVKLKGDKKEPIHLKAIDIKTIIDKL